MLQQKIQLFNVSQIIHLMFLLVSSQTKYLKFK